MHLQCHDITNVSLRQPFMDAAGGFPLFKSKSDQQVNTKTRYVIKKQKAYTDDIPPRALFYL